MKTKANSVIVSFQYDGEEEYQKKYSKSKEDALEYLFDVQEWEERSKLHTIKTISGTLTE